MNARHFFVPSSIFATMSDRFPEMASNMAVLPDEVVFEEVFMKSMESLLVPLSSAQKRQYKDSKCLVDVAVQPVRATWE